MAELRGVRSFVLRKLAPPGKGQTQAVWVIFPHLQAIEGRGEAMPLGVALQLQCLAWRPTALLGYLDSGHVQGSNTVD